MTTPSDLLEWLDERFPPSWAESWDNVGLQVGNRSGRIDRIVLALDPTVAVIHDAATGGGSTCLVTHHPLIFNALTTVELVADPTGAAVAAAVASQVTVIAVHTNADVAPGGVADILADLLGVVPSRDPLRQIGGREDAGIGRIGFLDQACQVKDIATRASEALGCTPRLIGDPSGSVSRLAVCGGSGGSYIADAAAAGADAFVTGDIKHHAALDALARNFPVIDAGHYATEHPWVRAMQPQLAAAFPEIDVQLSMVHTDPFVAREAS